MKITYFISLGYYKLKNFVPLYSVTTQVIEWKLIESDDFSNLSQMWGESCILLIFSPSIPNKVLRRYLR